MRSLAFVLVLAFSASASAEDWSKFVDHGDDTAHVIAPAKSSQPTQASQPRATARAAKAQAKPAGAKPTAAKAARAHAAKKPARK